MGANSDPEALVGRLLGGRYRVVKEIARGGMGAVLEAVQEKLGRRVALKTLHPDLRADRVCLERFYREAHAAAALGHPNIVQVTDFDEGRGDEPPFLVMELLEGRSLMKLLQEEAPLAQERAVALTLQVLDALQVAHQAGIVHRDLKASNIVVIAMAGGQELVKIVDFGIAKVIASGTYARLTDTGVLVGSPQYMAPEQLRGEETDHRADIYAVGVVFYMMLTGQRPFDGDTMALVQAILKERPMPAHEIVATVAPDLTAIVECALEKDRTARFPTAEAMAEALTTWQRSRATPSVPPSLRAPTAPVATVSTAPPRSPAAPVSAPPPEQPISPAPSMSPGPSMPPARPASVAPPRPAPWDGSGRAVGMGLGLMLVLGLLIVVALLVATLFAVAYSGDDDSEQIEAVPVQAPEPGVTVEPPKPGTTAATLPQHAATGAPIRMVFTGYAGNAYPRQVVQAKVMEQEAAVARCFAAAPEPYGLYVWNVIVDGSGKTTSTEFVSATSTVAGLDPCMGSLLAAIPWGVTGDGTLGSFQIRIYPVWD